MQSVCSSAIARVAYRCAAALPRVCLLRPQAVHQPPEAQPLHLYALVCDDPRAPRRARIHGVKCWPVLQRVAQMQLGLQPLRLRHLIHRGSLCSSRQMQPQVRLRALRHPRLRLLRRCSLVHGSRRSGMADCKQVMARHGPVPSTTLRQSKLLALGSCSARHQCTQAEARLQLLRGRAASQGCAGVSSSSFTAAASQPVRRSSTRTTSS